MSTTGSDDARGAAHGPGSGAGTTPPPDRAAGTASPERAPHTSRRRPGPRPSMDVEQIVRTGIEIADAEGLEAVSMAAVARRLGFTPMSLYRYLSGKDELLTRMQDVAVGPPPPTVPEGWRAGLAAWATTYLHRALEHPWVVQVPVPGPPVSPTAVRWMEQGLAALDGTPLGPGAKINVVLVLNNLTTSYVRLISGMRHGAEQAGGAEVPRYDDALRTLTDPLSFPALTELLDAGVFAMPTTPGDVGLLDDFSFGLTLVLDGVAALVSGKPLSPELPESGR
ncbi:TetR/AcrR family transcriptional regulator [Georgenia sp. SUBG003]|uniref:TetR/AcrR family transcriptional regulator C-terminal domain-containing protein n=1 Tax=Georgenia sp. SUBG003 TaxID=1497974 RepID=UPI0006950DC0